MVGYFLKRPRYRLYLRGFSLRSFNRRDIRSLLRMGLPIASQMFLESSAFVGTGIMMGWFGKEALSANQIAMTLGNCAFMIVLSIGAALYQLADGVQNVSVGILRGIQDVHIIMPIALVSYWVLNLPVGYLLGFTLGMGPSGLFVGFSFGLSAAALMLILRIRRSVHRLRTAA